MWQIHRDNLSRDKKSVKTDRMSVFGSNRIVTRGLLCQKLSSWVILPTHICVGLQCHEIHCFTRGSRISFPQTRKNTTDALTPPFAPPGRFTASPPPGAGGLLVCHAQPTARALMSKGGRPAAVACAPGSFAGRPRRSP